ncbi:hypothetical protein DFJ58DRAFT_817739 [Suillus subalutaceus]|uniref:uncharacterized protein n=1 Tax=Suillus subalutaceus TaxID=48586 RepID=UPI001B876280|nr:uncharacterized protein DFJ58DRAFT_817739 [Suillus subalutaceus]KAG1836722.1 hypothetical protein DFJ58DRAFT_817739 [Suillus subalutaceus]
MAKTRVIVVGAGIAGPVLAIFLKTKGYDPIVYERLPSPAEGGLSFLLQPNGLRDDLLFSLDGKEDILVDNDVAPDTMREHFGFPMIGVRRAEFQQLLIDTAEKHGIKIKWGHQAIEFEQSEDAVEVTFANGIKDTASFVIGCDGLHSNTRIALFGKENANFTGLVQFGGLSPTPPALRGKGVSNYGNGRHMVYVPCQGDWKTQHVEQQNEIRRGSLSDWGIVKYGLYDRPELKSWFKGRIHLGQGANQAFEDIYHIMRLLKKYNPSAGHPSTELLSARARQQGEARVVEGIDACRVRDEKIRAGSQDDAARMAHYELLSGPFKDSEM